MALQSSNRMMSPARPYWPRTFTLALTGIWLLATMLSFFTYWHGSFSLDTGSGFVFVQNGHLVVSAGGLALPKQPAVTPGPIPWNAALKPFQGMTTTETLGFQLAVSRAPAGKRSIYVSIPLWMPYLILVSISASRWAKSHRRRIFWTKPNECRKCNYNLTGNISGVCPECGTEVSQPRISRMIGPLLTSVRLGPVFVLLLVSFIGWRVYTAEKSKFPSPPIPSRTVPRNHKTIPIRD